MPRSNPKPVNSPKPKPSPKSLRSTNPKPKSAPDPTSPPSAPSSLELQQKILTIFRDSLSPNPSDKPLLQEIKTHLFARNFSAAFGKPEFLRVYASRWSPSRALGYLQVFTDIQVYLFSGRPGKNDDGATTMRVLAIGGGAGAEVVGLGAWVHSVRRNDGEDRWEEGFGVGVRILDVAAWDGVVSALHESVVSAPKLSKYASAAARANNHAMVGEGGFDVRFEQRDVLDSEEMIGAGERVDLVTIMFTLNELYSTSVPKTQGMLRGLGAGLRPGALLLVVDSPGSYSTVTINGSEKKYPMQWLLDHTLLESPRQKGNSDSTPAWEKLVADESRWFRVPPELQYPIDLENMRYQIHLYRRLADNQVAEQ